MTIGNFSPDMLRFIKIKLIGKFSNLSLNLVRNIERNLFFKRTIGNNHCTSMH